MVQTLLDNSPQAVWYYGDLFVTYKALVYTPDIHTAMPDKSETYRVEGVNAELRHYLARLRRKTGVFAYPRENPVFLHVPQAFCVCLESSSTL